MPAVLVCSHDFFQGPVQATASNPPSQVGLRACGLVSTTKTVPASTVKLADREKSASRNNTAELGPPLYGTEALHALSSPSESTQHGVSHAKDVPTLQRSGSCGEPLTSGFGSRRTRAFRNPPALDPLRSGLPWPHNPRPAVSTARHASGLLNMSGLQENRVVVCCVFRIASSTTKVVTAAMRLPWCAISINLAVGSPAYLAMTCRQQCHLAEKCFGVDQRKPSWPRSRFVGRVLRPA